MMEQIGVRPSDATGDRLQCHRLRAGFNQQCARRRQRRPPHRPRPWYIIWAAMVWGGFEFASSPERADAAFYFEDQTIATPPQARHAKAFNFGVGDVSKSTVARVMEEAFGYQPRPIARFPFVEIVDPLTAEP